jgi:hydroxymethylbilane synthase
MSSKRTIKIGTRGSKLALIQANMVHDKLRALNIESELVIIKTTGDKITNKPLYDIGGKALFLKEIEEAMLAKEVDLAVHSMKDVPGELPQGLKIAAVLEREDPRDVLVAKYPTLQELPKGSVVGTSSVRRMMQAKAINPNIEVKPIRGNVDSRLNKYLNGEFDAIILASAGLKRLNITSEDFHYIPFEAMIPAVGQGIIALEIRENDEYLTDICIKLNHQQTWIELQVERGFLETLQGSCRTPMGAYAKIIGNFVECTFFLSEIDGSNIRTCTDKCTSNEAYEMGKRVALSML